MELSITEAATLLGRSPRTVRTWLATGRLAGKKKGGRWRIDRAALPLSDPQRARVQRRAARIRATVDDVLPARLDDHRGPGRRGLADLDVFQIGVELLASWEGEEHPRLLAAAGSLEEGLLELSRGHHEFHPRLKLTPFRRARAAPASERTAPSCAPRLCCAAIGGSCTSTSRPTSRVSGSRRCAA